MALSQWYLASANQFPLTFLARDEVSPTAACQQSCAELTLEFGSAVHPGGNDSTFVIWDAKQQEVVPACRVEPTTAVQVSRIIDILIGHWCRFAVKGGGHSTNPDASNSIGGVTIDLHNMNHVEILDNSTRANLGPGLILYEAYTALEKHNLTTVAGRVADVGVPGFTLGGGFSNLGPQYGLAADNVFEYQVVLPNATIVNVSETVNPDLYFALRGGGNNFGIVTNFQVRVIPQGTVMGGLKTYHDNYTDALTEQSYELTTVLSNDTYMCFSNRYYWDPEQNRYRMTFNQAYTKPVLKPAVFDALNQIPFEDSNIRLDYVSNFTTDEVATYGSRRVYATVTHRPSQKLHKDILQIYRDEVEGVKNVAGFSSSIVVQALHLNAIQAMKNRGGNALGVESDVPLTVVLLTLGWTNKVDDTVMYAYADRWVERATTAATEMALLHRWKYINYANYNQDPFSGYGEENKLRLQRIQKSIDSKGIFTSQGLCRGSFKVL
ncbi:FAD binding domain protein [Truncatella angustata]|uniref:FAD binding domain protein n=1 Tax=Truncatella angustata TaxID=152316 RepID=A0A9P8UMH5_9PEZI|nr:FAD binding domain protein [Truncatella angustata]KAH6654804.1 FAD binding domain protein [Truncatella angustata]